MNFGGAVTPLLVALLSRSFGWQGALLWIALPVTLLNTRVGWYGRNNAARACCRHGRMKIAELGSGAAEAARPPTARRLLKLLSDRNVLLLSLSYLCMKLRLLPAVLLGVPVSGANSALQRHRRRHGRCPAVDRRRPGRRGGGFISDRLAERIGVRWGYRLVPLLALPVAGILLLVTLRVATPYAAVATLAAAFFMVEITEGAYGAAVMQVARTDVAAAFGVLNTGGNVGGNHRTADHGLSDQWRRMGRCVHEPVPYSP